MISLARQTGRTERMLMRALRVAESGENVLIVAASIQHKGSLKRDWEKLWSPAPEAKQLARFVTIDGDYAPRSGETRFMDHWTAEQLLATIGWRHKNVKTF